MHSLGRSIDGDRVFCESNMRCLILHCKSFAYTLDHPTPVAEKLSEASASEAFNNCLVVFASAEPNDSSATAESASVEIAKIVGAVKVDQVLLNPFAHLSSTLAKPKQAISVLRATVQNLANQGIQTHYSPFGWYKGFSFEVLAHDSSQLFRVF